MNLRDKASAAASPIVRAVADLSVFSEIDGFDFGRDLDGQCAELFSRPYQGLMRTSTGGYTDGSVFVHRNQDIKALVTHAELGNQPVDVYTAPYRAYSERQPPGLCELMRNNLFTMQPPDHAPARQLVTRRLTTKSIVRFAPLMRELVEHLIDQAAERGQVDFRREVSSRVMRGFWQFALGWSEEEAVEASELAATSQLSNLLNPTPDQRRAVNAASRN